MKRKILIPLVIVTCATAWAAGAQTPARAQNAGSSSAAEQRLRQDVQAMLTHMVASGALGQHPETLHLRVEQPAQRVSDLGVLIDSTSAERARDGLRVLGTSPGSTAERLGLRPGDVLVGVNGTSLRNLGPDSEGHALAAATLKSAVDRLPDATPLQLDVEREGNLLALNAPVHSVLLPALSIEVGSTATAAADPPGATASAGTGCGRISTFDVAPRGEQKFHAVILLLDGSTPAPNGGETYRVAAGTHKLLVAEDIPLREIGAGPIASPLRARGNTNKELTITVRPNTTAMIGAQFNHDHATDFVHAGYWTPVVWREVPENCP